MRKTTKSDIIETLSEDSNISVRETWKIVESGVFFCLQISILWVIV